METIKQNRGRALTAVLSFLVGCALTLGFAHPPFAQAQDPAYSQPPLWFNATATAPAGTTAITANTTARYVVKSLIITDTVSEKISLLDGATVVFQINVLANQPLTLGSDFFGPTGYVPAAVNTAFKYTAPTGVVSLSGRYVAQ